MRAAGTAMEYLQSAQNLDLKCRLLQSRTRPHADQPCSWAPQQGSCGTTICVRGCACAQAWKPRLAHRAHPGATRAALQ